MIISSGDAEYFSELYISELHAVIPNGFIERRVWLNLVIDIKNVEWLKENEGDLDRAEEQLQLLFNNVLESLSSFDITKPSFAMLDLTPVIQDSI